MSEADQIFDVSPAAEASVAVRQLSPGLSSTPRTLWGDAWRRFRRHRLAMVGSAMLIFFILAVTLGPTIYVAVRVRQAEQAHTPIPVNDRTFMKMLTKLDYVSVMAKPSSKHPFGTDELGRDLLARSLYGGRISLS